MAGELPYFKFYPDEWFAGKIYRRGGSTQGLFINICAQYWKRKGNICLSDVPLLFEDCEGEFEELLEKGIIQLEKGTSVEHMLGEEEEEREEEKRKESTKETRLVISFLDEQLVELGAIQKKRVVAGKKSGMKRRKNREDVLSKKLKKFQVMCLPYIDKYEPAMMTEFINYWTETKPQGLMMRWEMQQAFDIPRRLATWYKNERTYTARTPKNTVGSRQYGKDKPIKKYRKSKEL
jgi:hypothetical protein